jgi:Family of unknown function (DUF6338)
MDGWEAVATFALAAVPGVFVVEIFQFQKPRLREWSGLKGIALYLIISALVWATAALVFQAHAHLASVIDSADRGGSAQVAAYIALAWRLAVTAIGLGVALRLMFAGAEWIALRIERERRSGDGTKGGLVGDRLIELFSMSYAWDALMVRLRRQARAQVVHVRLRDGSDVYGVLASGGGADFQAEGRGIVLDIELVDEEGNLNEVPGSNGIFIVPEAVATIAFLDYLVSDPTARVEP